MDGLVFTCQIGKLPATTFQVVEFSLREALSELYHLNLTVVSALDTVLLGEQLGMAASLTIRRDGVVERTINGIVAGAEQGNSDGRRTYYTFTIRPEMWRMTLNQDSRIFHRLTVPDMLKQLLKEHHIKSDSKFYEEEGYHPVREYTTQKRESAYDFWCRLAAEEGITFWFEEDKLFYSNSHLGMLAGLFLTYNPQADTDNTDTAVSQWRYGEFLCPDEFVHKDNNFLRPSYPLQHEARREQGHGHGVFESYGRFQLDAEGQPQSLLRLNQINSESKMGSASTNCIQLRPGKIFVLNRHPIATMNDRWQVVSITHHGVQPQAAGTAGEGTTLTNSLTFIPGWDDWRPPYRYKPMADGDEVATVVGPEGEEIFVNEHGAIKVHFHWNRYDEPGDGSSCWVRVAQGWNGHGFGFMAIPRIGQEVIVSYLNGDIDRPIVTGCTYNGRNRPPLDLPAEKTRTTFRTQTHKGDGFNELRFEDAKGSEEVYIHGQKDFTAHIENDVHWHIQHDQKQRIDNNHYSDIQADEHSQVKGSRKYSTEGDVSHRITGSQHIQAGDALLSESAQETHVKSGGRIVLEAATEISLKVGGAFIKVTPGCIQSSMINVGAGSGSSGRGIALQLPEGVPALPDVKFPVKKYCACQAQESAAWVIKSPGGKS
ncbi:type VI secretion system Vgr family protein [Xenorhabdus sp. Sc-CR9]|uniref:type VI secretion system Vgr family protein n=1 Tax=Xenorhabdus sp. Sc-CR9 TaxID=2584468 RepID=UPI001F02E054|nr:type VI secretion system tip protein TssI/VgrG [Xenorhabdus sp. Sc-CR9]